MAITLFPLLVSNTVSKNIVPGVAKVLENYIIAYGLDDILSQLRKEKGKANYRISNNKVIKRESVSSEISNFLYNEMLDEQRRSQIYGATGSGNKLVSGKDQDNAYEYNEKLKDTEREARAKEKGKQALGGRDSSVRLDMMNLSSISLEPTWMKMDQIDSDGTRTSGIIGVKVVPYLVKSDASLSRLLMYDRQVGKLQGFAIRKGRQMTTGLYNIWKKAWLKLPFTSLNTTVSGDPRKDIILKRSIMHSKSIQSIFALANQSELSDSFLGTAKGVMNLQKMGWGSLIVADDVNRRVAFCMKELKGLCSMMPYTMLYQTFSQAKVYEDIEDAKRTSSSIFKVRREKLTKLVGEGIAETKVEEFGNQNLPLLESGFITEAEYIDENLGSFMKKLTPSNLKTIIPNIIKGKAKNIPNSSPEKIVKLATKLNPEFRKGYVLAKKVIANSSPDVSSDLVDWAAIMVAVRASLKKGASTFMEEVKHGLKLTMKLFRRTSQKAKMPREHIVDATFGWTYILICLSALAYLIKEAGYIGTKVWNFIVPLYKSGASKLAGIDQAAAKQAAEDWTTATVETTKEFATDYGPWIGITLVIVAYLYSKVRR